MNEKLQMGIGWLLTVMVAAAAVLFFCWPAARPAVGAVTVPLGVIGLALLVARPTRSNPSHKPLESDGIAFPHDDYKGTIRTEPAEATYAICNSPWHGIWRGTIRIDDRGHHCNPILLSAKITLNRDPLSARLLDSCTTQARARLVNVDVIEHDSSTDTLFLGFDVVLPGDTRPRHFTVPVQLEFNRLICADDDGDVTANFERLAPQPQDRRSHHAKRNVVRTPSI